MPQQTSSQELIRNLKIRSREEIYQLYLASTMVDDDLRETNVFHFQDGAPNFESFGVENGKRMWYARDLMAFLGYRSWDSFSRVITKAFLVMDNLKMRVPEHVQYVSRMSDGIEVNDMKLSRLACYHVTLRAETKNHPAVIKALGYFAEIANLVQDYQDEIEKADRVEKRTLLSEKEKSLSGVAKLAGVNNYSSFGNARYQGLYDMSIARLRAKRSIPKEDSPLDYMGSYELVANTFAISQTELKLKNSGRTGQSGAESIAKSVGKKVRDTVHEIQGVYPENLPKQEHINSTKKQLKSSSKAIEGSDRRDKDHNQRTD